VKTAHILEWGELANIATTVIEAALLHTLGRNRSYRIKLHTSAALPKSS
jgi:hypothetical protein